MLGIKNLKEFLVEAKKSTYASGNESVKNKNVDGSTSFMFQSDDFNYYDNYFGGEPYGGREVVFYKNEPVFMMVYYGSVDKDVSDLSEVYGVLRKALLLIPADYPYRGPSEVIEGGYKYKNNYLGEVDNFSGEESIECNGKIIYRAKYLGGFVDQRKRK